MTIKGMIREWINRPLAHFNVRIETLTAERAEIARLLRLERQGLFNRPAFPVPTQFVDCDPSCVLEAVEKYKQQTKRFREAASNNEYSYANDYFTSPDAEVAYAIVQMFRPKRLIEVGSGNSTLLFRAAVQDSRLGTKIVSIDPCPRRAIERGAHHIVKEQLEFLQSSEIFTDLGFNDILFIDSSHQIHAGNDVLKLLLNIVPALAKGVLIHIHDIFLPFEYPREWLIDHRWEWTEQYLVQAMLHGSSVFDVLWPGHYLQRTWPEFATVFDVKPQRTAKSLWLRKVLSD
jgi:hypothetical protein